MASSAQALDCDHDVTRANFSDKLPIIRQALQECSFYSFDLGGSVLGNSQCMELRSPPGYKCLGVVVALPRHEYRDAREMLYKWKMDAHLTTDAVAVEFHDNKHRKGVHTISCVVNTEMTGLFMDSCHANYLDDMQDRASGSREQWKAARVVFYRRRIVHSSLFDQRKAEASCPQIPVLGLHLITPAIAPSFISFPTSWACNGQLIAVPCTLALPGMPRSARTPAPLKSPSSGCLVSKCPKTAVPTKQRPLMPMCSLSPWRLTCQGAQAHANSCVMQVRMAESKD
eukprot:1144127-Pelagomonas_calceolata.AAC.1